MDHLVFAAPDLDEGVAYLERLFGVETAPGGQHHGFGTCNRLVGFGPTMYMEVISVDPSQSKPEGPRWFGLDELAEPRLVTWCTAHSDLDQLIARGRSAGIDLGGASVGGRERPDGTRLSWTVTDPWADRAEGVIPFFIDWGDTPHPGTRLPALCSFVGIRLEHPRSEAVAVWLDALGVDVPIIQGTTPRVIATIETPNGVVELC